MTGQNPLDFIQLNESSEKRSGGQVVSWITSCWKDKKGTVWEGRPLKKLVPDDWFELHTQYMTRLWTPHPAAMKNVVRLFNEDHLVHHHIPHVFAIPHFMTYPWRKKLFKYTDFLFTVNVGPLFWTHYLHEPLIVLIVLPLDHVPNYRYPWVLRGSPSAIEVHNQLEARFKHPELHGCRKLHELEGPVLSCLSLSNIFFRTTVA